MATNPDGPARKTSVSMPSSVLLAAQREAKRINMTFSAYVRGLVKADLRWPRRPHVTGQHPVEMLARELVPDDVDP